MKQFPRMIFVLLFTFTISICIHAQQSEETKRGIEFYNQGNDAEAIKLLKEAAEKDKNDIEARYYLGLTYARSGKTKDASKAFEQAAARGYEIFLEQVEPGGDEQNLSFVNLKNLFEPAYKSAEQYLLINPNLKTKKREEWEGLAAILKGLTDYVNGSLNENVYKPSEVTTKARITYNPQPEYTEDARKSMATGTIRLQVVLGKDGKVWLIIPVIRLAHSLTEKAVKAARKIKFIPATKDGQPVSQWITIEYNFEMLYRRPF